MRRPKRWRWIVPLPPNFHRYVSTLQKGEGSPLLRAALWVISRLYGFGVFLRNFAYDRGWLRAYGVSIPVISVGNVVAGGGGKTPFTLFLAEQLSKDLKVAVISRGYGSSVEKRGESAVMCAGDGPVLSPEEGGDEPFLMARRLPKLLVVVGPDRVRSARIAEGMGAEVVLMDDGMQHRRLRRNVEIVLIDSGCPLGFGHLLPRGLLREPVRNLRRADLVVISKVRDSERFQSVATEVGQFSASPVMGTALEAEGFYDPSGQRVSLKKGAKVAVFCGVARPEQVFEVVKEQGVVVVGTLSTTDHQLPTRDALMAFARRTLAEGACALVTTEKDGVKELDFSFLPLPVYNLRVRLVITFNETGWSRFLKFLPVVKKFSTTSVVDNK